MEHLLINWIDEQISKSISISKYSLCNQAKLWVEHFDEVLGVETSTHFQSSHGWVRNFFKRFGLNNISDLEVPTKKINDVESVNKFVSKLEKIIVDGKFRPEQIFNLDECGVNWRFLPTNKAPKEHFTLLIGKQVHLTYTALITIPSSRNECGRRLQDQAHFDQQSRNPKRLGACE